MDTLTKPQNQSKTDGAALRTIEELGGGSISQWMDAALAEAVKGSLLSEKIAEVKLQLKIKPSKLAGSPATIEAAIAYKSPTHKGAKQENATFETAMYLNKNGTATLVPDTQGRLPAVP